MKLKRKSEQRRPDYDNRIAIQERKFYLDDGNWNVKWADDIGNFGLYRNRVAVLSESEWLRAVGAGTLPPPYHLEITAKGETVYIVYGEKSLSYSPEIPEDAARYLPYRSNISYNALVMLASLTESYDRGSNNVTVHASHPPKDIDYVRRGVEMLQKALKGKWDVVSSKGRSTWNIETVLPLDEPICGAYAMVISDDSEWIENELQEYTLLGLDGGGSTLDLTHIDKGFSIDYSPERLKSYDRGTIAVVEAFERDLKHGKYSDKFINATRGLDPRRVEEALLTGFYRYGQKRLKVTELAKQHRNRFAEDVKMYIERAGAANYDDIYLTGGGMVFIEKELRKMFPHWNVYTAYRTPDEAVMANVRGMRNFFQYLRISGEI